MTTNVYVKRAILVTTVSTLTSLITVSLNLAKMEPTAAISWKIISVTVHKVLMYVCMRVIYSSYSWSRTFFLKCFQIGMICAYTLALYREGIVRMIWICVAPALVSMVEHAATLLTHLDVPVLRDSSVPFVMTPRRTRSTTVSPNPAKMELTAATSWITTCVHVHMTTMYAISIKIFTQLSRLHWLCCV